MPRPRHSGVCATADCPQDTIAGESHCAAHTRPAWQGSTRRARLPGNWNTIRARILRRDPVCQCAGCQRCTPNGCHRPSTDCDHIRSDDDHTPTALQGLCHGCHTTKTARDRTARTVTRPHPGGAG